MSFVVLVTKPFSIWFHVKKLRYIPFTRRAIEARFVSYYLLAPQGLCQAYLPAIYRPAPYKGLFVPLYRHPEEESVKSLI